MKSHRSIQGIMKRRKVRNEEGFTATKYSLEIPKETSNQTCDDEYNYTREELLALGRKSIYFPVKTSIP